MATLESIARNLNLSTATVSRALRGSHGVNQKTRARVHQAAEELGYAKMPRVEKPRDILLLVPGKSPSDTYELARRHMLVIADEIAKRGWRMIPLFLSAERDHLLTALNRPSGEPAEGSPHAAEGCLVIGQLTGCGDEPDSLQRLLVERFEGRVAMVCREDVRHGLSGVAAMNYIGGAEAAELLLQAGHRRIGWIGSLGSQDVAEERLGGALTRIFRTPGAALEHQIWLDDTQLLPLSQMTETLSNTLSAQKDQWPTAWICSTDWLAAKLIVWARQQGLAVPQTMSVVAFDNTQLAEELAEVTISSVVFPYEQIARKAVELLESLLNTPAPDAIAWTLPPRLRKGETVHPPVKRHAARD